MFRGYINITIGPLPSEAVLDMGGRETTKLDPLEYSTKRPPPFIYV